MSERTGERGLRAPEMGLGPAAGQLEALHRRPDAGAEPALEGE